MVGQVALFSQERITCMKDEGKRWHGVFGQSVKIGHGSSIGHMGEESREEGRAQIKKIQ